MTLEGAINFNETDLYTIYTVNSANAGQYCVVLPKSNTGVYNVLVDLHMKSLFDSVNSGVKTKDDLVNEIGSEYNNIKTKYNDGILVIPMFDENNYVNIINADDKQKMFDEVKKIGAITSELYKKLIDGGVDKQKIDQKIIIVEKNDYDKKFVEWLKGQMPNFVSSVSMSELSAVNSNPFMTDNNASSDVNNIFGAPVVETSNVTPVEEVNANVVPEGNLQSNDLFGTPEVPAQPETVVPPVVETPIQQPVVEDTQIPNVFGEQPTQQNVVNEVPPVVPPVQQPVQQVVPEAQPVEAPKPVQSVELDKTVTFSPVSDNTSVNIPVQQAVPVENPVPATGDGNVAGSDGASADGQLAKKSNGFVNLAILLVILVGVTLVSIELGKFLYNTYGV